MSYSQLNSYANALYMPLGVAAIVAGLVAASLEARLRATQYRRLVNLGNLFAFLALVAGQLALVSGNSLQRAKEMKLHREMTASGERIKVLQNERIVLRRDLKSETTKARNAYTQLALEQTKLARAHKDLADAERKRTEAQLILQKSLEAVREHQRLRMLTGVQRRKLVSCLRRITKGPIVLSIAQDKEAIGYGMQLYDLLLEVGWPVESVEFNMSPEAFPRGVVILLPRAGNPPTHALELARSLSEAGVGTPLKAEPELVGQVTLSIGWKP